MCTSLPSKATANICGGRSKCNEDMVTTKSYYDEGQDPQTADLPGSSLWTTKSPLPNLSTLIVKLQIWKHKALKSSDECPVGCSSSSSSSVVSSDALMQDCVDRREVCENKHLVAVSIYTWHPCLFLILWRNCFASKTVASSSSSPEEEEEDSSLEEAASRDVANERGSYLIVKRLLAAAVTCEIIVQLTINMKIRYTRTLD